MPKPTGQPIWYELLSSDTEASQRFYCDVVGWTATDSGQDDMDYRILSAPDGNVAGLMNPPEGMGGSGWYLYLHVPDMEQGVARLKAAGGTVHKDAWDVPGIGRMAFVADEQGSFFYLMQPTPPAGGIPEGTATPFQNGDVATAGHAVWNELPVDDPDAAINFYRNAFGWTQDGGMPMGERGQYRFLQAGDVGLGAVMQKLPDEPAGWLVYFLVEDIDAGLKRIEAGGGRRVAGPDPIPGSGFSLVATDPHGHPFGLVGERKS